MIILNFWVGLETYILQEIIKNLLEDCDESLLDVTSVCVACLGILQDRYCSEDFCQEVY